MFSSVHHQGTLTKYPGQITKTGISKPENSGHCGYKPQKSLFRPVKEPVQENSLQPLWTRKKTGHRNKSPGTSTGEKKKTGSHFPIVKYFHKAIKQKNGAKAPFTKKCSAKNR